MNHKDKVAAIDAAVVAFFADDLLQEWAFRKRDIADCVDHARLPLLRMLLAQGIDLGEDAVLLKNTRIIEKQIAQYVSDNLPMVQRPVIFTDPDQWGSYVQLEKSRSCDRPVSHRSRLAANRISSVPLGIDQEQVETVLKHRETLDGADAPRFGTKNRQATEAELFLPNHHVTFLREACGQVRYEPEVTVDANAERGYLLGANNTQACKVARFASLGEEALPVSLEWQYRIAAQLVKEGVDCATFEQFVSDKSFALKMLPVWGKTKWSELANYMYILRDVHETGKTKRWIELDAPCLAVALIALLLRLPRTQIMWDLNNPNYSDSWTYFAEECKTSIPEFKAYPLSTLRGMLKPSASPFSYGGGGKAGMLNILGMDDFETEVARDKEPVTVDNAPWLREIFPGKTDEEIISVEAEALGNRLKRCFTRALPFVTSYNSMCLDRFKMLGCNQSFEIFGHRYTLSPVKRSKTDTHKVSYHKRMKHGPDQPKSVTISDLILETSGLVLGTSIDHACDKALRDMVLLNLPHVPMQCYHDAIRCHPHYADEVCETYLEGVNVIADNNPLVTHLGMVDIARRDVQYVDPKGKFLRI